jgi:hypothetical protein
MKRYDTHRNFPPARRPRDSTPAPPEDDELEQLLTTSPAGRSDALVTAPEADVAIEAKTEPEPSAPLPSSVESALTAYVESLPASDPEPRIEEREIDVDAEAARRGTSPVDVVSANSTRTETAADAELSAPNVEEKPPVPKAAPSGDDDEEDDDDDDDDPNSLAPASRRLSEPAPVDSVAATARSTAPAAVAKRGTSPVVWIAGFALGGMALALWATRQPTETREREAVHAASPAVERAAPAPPEPAATPPFERAALAPPTPSASAAIPAASAR